MSSVQCTLCGSYLDTDFTLSKCTNPLCPSNEPFKYSSCIGIDGLQHVCKPDKDVCKCGVKIKRKKMLRDDWQRSCCYECTY
jgi:hypothetical protein